MVLSKMIWSKEKELWYWKMEASLKDGFKKINWMDMDSSIDRIDIQEICITGNKSNDSSIDFLKIFFEFLKLW